MRKLIIVLLSFLAMRAGAQVTLWGAKDNSMPNFLNIGAGKTKATNPKAYLELGDSIFSKKGFLPPRGWKDSISSPVKGLQIHDIPSNRPKWYDGSAWRDFGGGKNYSAGYGLSLLNDTVFAVDSLVIATRARLKHVIDSLAAASIDSLYQGPDLDLIYRKGGVEHSIYGVFNNIYNSDGSFVSDRNIDGAGYELNFINLRAFRVLLDNIATNNTYSEFVKDEYTAGLKYGRSNPGAIGTTDYHSFAHMSFTPLANGKTYGDLYAMRSINDVAANRIHHHLRVYPDSTVFVAFSADSTIRQQILKIKKLPVSISGTYYAIVTDTLTGQLYWKAQTVATTPSLQAVTDVGSTTTNPITAAGFSTKGFMTVTDIAGIPLIYMAGDEVNAGQYAVKEKTPGSVTSIANAGILIANSSDSSKPYWIDKYGNVRKLAFYGDAGGGTITTTDNNLTISGTTISTKKSVQTFTDGPTITIDCSLGYNWKGTIAGNRNIVITNFQEGQYLTIEINQDNTGLRTATPPSGSRGFNGMNLSGGAPLPLSTTGSAKDVAVVWYDGVNYIWAVGKNAN